MLFVHQASGARLGLHLRVQLGVELGAGCGLLVLWHGLQLLLDLGAALLEGRQVSVSSLCIAAAVPTTTALRWVKTMVDRGLFLRASDPEDARRAFILLSPQAESALDACLDAVLNQPGQ